jgi:hypothetical protein
MKALSNVLLTVVAFALAAGVAVAQEATVPSHGGSQVPRRPRPPIDTALDVNGDEIIDAGELANALAALATLDRNADGQLTPDEYRPPRPDGRGAGRGGAEAGRQDQGPDALPPEGARPPQGEGMTAGGPPAGRPPRQPIVSALDASGDGEIDASEIAKASDALRKLDANGDGRLSPDEYRPPRPDGQREPRDAARQGAGK